MPDTEGRSIDVAVLAPTGRDGALAEQALARWTIAATAYPSMEAVVAAVGRGVGALVLAEEALVAPARALLVAELERQPSWSDLPLIILTAEGELSRSIANGIETIAQRANVLLLERPVRVATLLTMVRSALRARTRQYDVRDHLRSLSIARAEAEAANRAKVEFLAMMSHELRTPLNAIGGYAELMEIGVRGAITSEQREDLARIQKSQRHLLGLINGVLNYARIERGSVSYETSNVSLREILATAESLVALQARARRLALDVVPPEADLAALADRDKVQQVLLNLLSNAIKFTEPGGRIGIAAERRGDFVAVTVEDTGLGVPPGKIDSIFEPFIQVDSHLTRTQDGVGLGLAISRDLARGMGGDLTAESTPGVGSRFTLTLLSA